MNREMLPGGTTRYGMTVGALLDAKRLPRKRTYEEIERNDVKQEIVRELATMAMESDRNEQDVYIHTDFSADSDLPDEIECQLIQKTLLINGTVQTIDFIMCNQCPRLFRTENLLWNHIKGKHNRRHSARRHIPIPPPPARNLSPINKSFHDRLEPGEIHGQDPISYAVDSSGLMDGEDQGEDINLIIEGNDDDIHSGSQPMDGRRRMEDDRENKEPEPVLQYTEVPSDSTGPRLSNSTIQSSGIHHSRVTSSGLNSNRDRIQPVVGLQQRKKDDAVYVVGVEKRKPQEEMKTERAGYGSGEYNNYGNWKFTCWKGSCTGQVFTNRKHIEAHIKRYHDELAVECDICGKQVTNIQRHREVSHKKFRAFDCTHCGDKFCSREDLDRHLSNVEKRNRVSQGQSASDFTPSKDEEKDTDREEREDEEIAKFVKELESQTFSCSDCGVKTPSRMTYMQHVLNGCIMDQPTKTKKGDRKYQYRRDVRERCVAPAISKHVIIQHDGRREHIIVEQERDLAEAVREQLGHPNQREPSAIQVATERTNDEDVDGQLADDPEQERGDHHQTSNHDRLVDHQQTGQPQHEQSHVQSSPQVDHQSSSEQQSDVGIGEDVRLINDQVALHQDQSDGHHHVALPDQNSEHVVIQEDQSQGELHEDQVADQVILRDQNGDHVVLQQDQNAADHVVLQDENGDPVVLQQDQDADQVILRDENGDQVVLQDENGDQVVLQDENGDQVVLQQEHNGDQMILRDQNGDEVVLQQDEDGSHVYEEVHHEGGNVLHHEDNVLHQGENVLHLADDGSGEGRYVHIVQDENGETHHVLIDQSDGMDGTEREVLQIIQEGGDNVPVLQVVEGDNAPVLQVVEGEEGEHVIHVTEEQLAQLQAQSNLLQQ